MRRCFDAVLKKNGDHFRGHLPFTLQVIDVCGVYRGDGWIIAFTFEKFEPLYAIDESATPIGVVLLDVYGRVALSSLGLT